MALRIKRQGDKTIATSGGRMRFAVLTENNGFYFAGMFVDGIAGMFVDDMSGAEDAGSSFLQPVINATETRPNTAARDISFFMRRYLRWK